MRQIVTVSRYAVEGAALVAVCPIVAGIAIAGGALPTVAVFGLLAMTVGIYIGLRHPLWFYWALAVALGALPFGYFPGVHLPLTFGLGLAVLLAALVHPTERTRLSKLEAAIIGFVLASTLSLAVTAHTMTDISEFAKWTVSTMMVVALLRLSRANLATFGRIYVYASAAAAVFALVVIAADREGQFIRYLKIVGYGREEDSTRFVYSATGTTARLSGTFIDPNTAGIGLLVALVVCAVLVRGWLRPVLAALFVCAILLTLSRAAIFSVLCGVMLVLLFHTMRSRDRQLIVGAVGLAVMLALAAPQVRRRVFSSFGDNDAGSTAREDALANYSHQMAGHWWFGLGWGRPEFKDPSKAFAVNHVANAPLLTVYRGGVITGLFFVAVLVIGCLMAYRALRSESTSSAFLGGVFISFCVIALQLDFPTVTIPSVAMMSSVLLVFLTYVDTYVDKLGDAARLTVQREPDTPTRPRSWARQGCSACVKYQRPVVGRNMSESPPRRTRRTIIAVVLAAIIGLVAATLMMVVLPKLKPRTITVTDTASINPVPTTIGVADGGDVLGLAAADLNRTLDSVVTAGSRTLRIPIPWSTVEPIQGQQNWSSIDAIVNAAVGRSMSILGVVAFTPRWAQAPGGNGISGQPAQPAQFGNYAKSVAQRYNGKISAYEIWNEPNSSLFFSPSPNPSAYTSLLKAAYPQIKSVSSSITVIGGVVGSVVDSGSTMNPVTFVTQMYSADAKNFFDALSFHAYQYGLPLSAGMSVANSPVQQLMQMRQLMLSNGDEAKKIWASEYGQPTSIGGEGRQQQYITDFVTKWQEMPYTGPIMIYRTRDKNANSSDPEDTFGLFRTDWMPKQAQHALQWLIANGVPKSAEFQRFSTVTDASHGTVLSPVYRATQTVWAQRRTVNTLYETPSGLIASPNPVADKAQPFGVVPKTPFANGWQDFDTPYGLRIFYSQQTGAHAVGGGIAGAWTPKLGLALTDELPTSGGGIYVNFQHGKITWTPWQGVVVTYN